QQLDDVFADLVEPHPLLHEDGRGDRSLLAKNAEQQVLGADVVVQEPVRLFGGVLQDALGFSAERNLNGGRNLVAEDRAAFDVLANVFEREVRSGKNPARETFSFSDQSEQQVFGLN